MSIQTWMKVYYMENSNFIKYIIKKIVKVVYVKDRLDISRPFSEWYRIEKNAIDENLIREILDEGRRYGLSEKKTQFCIGQADRMINFTPSITEFHSSLDICTLPNGTHTRFIFENDTFGILTIDAIKDGKHGFFVLKSDIAAICWEDGLFFTINKLQCGAYPAFYIIRKSNQEALAASNYFCAGKLILINIYSPGITHEIIDSKTDFKKEKTTKVRDSKTETIQTSKLQTGKPSKKNKAELQKKSAVRDLSDVHYLWPPSRWKPIAFCFTDMDNNLKSPDYPPFMATVRSTTSADFTINPKFIETLRMVGEGRTDSYLYLLDTIIKTCKVDKQLASLSHATNIKVLSQGSLTPSSDGKNIWIMEKAPIIVIE